MSFIKKIPLIIILILFFTSINYFFQTPSSNPDWIQYQEFSPTIVADDEVSDKESVTDLHFVTRVVDGDTILVDINGKEKRVRYIGIDAPESVRPDHPVECFGNEASEYNRSLVEGKWVRLERDVSDTDKFGRLLRYIFIDDSLVNLKLVSNGYANAVTYQPDVKYNKTFLEAEKEARIKEKGLWGRGCST